jgi:hypothetical protein
MLFLTPHHPILMYRVTKSNNSFTKWYNQSVVLNATFNYILVISWQLVLLVEETGIPGENHRSAASHSQTLSHNAALSTPRLSGV